MEDDRHELPPAITWRPQAAATATYLLGWQINRLIEVALQLRPQCGLRALDLCTYSIASATGLRISEALKLTVAD